MRKALIAVIALVAVGIGFGIFVMLMDPSPVVVSQEQESPDIEIPQIETTPQKIGDITPIGVKKARYVKVDPVTGEPAAEYGFSKMLNPGQGRTRWEVEKPYIVFYRPDYACRIDSDMGVFQTEISGSSAVPKDAQLEKNVVIHIMPTQESDLGETYIYMDDLIFSSDRSEFTTDGPVRVESEKIRMDGLGLTLIFNTAEGRIEYLRLVDLDYLQLNDIASAEIPSPAGQADSAAEKTSSLPAEQKQSAQAVSPENTDEAISEEATASPDYYLCTIEDNVEIQYGRELIVSGADQVNIQNIDFSGMDEKKAASTSPEKPVATSTRPAVSHASAKTNTAGPLPDRSSAGSGRNVIVKCDGGIIFQPMPTQSAVRDAETGSELALEMSGRPLRIDRIVPAAFQESETLAHCALLKYKPAEDVLRLFTSPLQPEILLNAEESNSRIQTRGNVFWDRKAQHANIAGPGKVTIGNADRPNADPSEINFQGMMDLLFSHMPDEEMDSATIQTINLTGGMDAVLRQNGTLKTKSDSAVLEFGQENTLSKARLDGDVHLESLDHDKPSQAVSDTAVFHFTDNQIARADLAGGVRFASADGQFASSKAEIEFEPDAEGAMHPKVLRTTGQAVMQTVSETEQPPAKFEAQKIDYDLETGSGLAYGPIRVTYYEEPKDAACLDDWTPMTITADSDAAFSADANRSIKRVAFHDNVTVTRLVNMPAFVQRDQLHGDKLVVDFNEDEQGETAVSSIAITEGDVFAQSKKTHREEIVFNMKLYCERMDYDGFQQTIVAAGPGKIELDNSKVKPSAVGASESGMKLSHPCYAQIKDFDSLSWDIMEQVIVADGQEDTMKLVYIPLTDGQEDKYIYANTQQIRAEFLSNSNGGNELKRIYTDKGIIYEERDGTNQKTQILLAGQSLTYDVFSDAGWLTIGGSENNPCFINGIRVQQVRYNVNTGQLDETPISRTPGILSN